MDLPISLDRRTQVRGPLFGARRRYPRLRVAVEAFYESDSCSLVAGHLELSLRGAFMACRTGDVEGTSGVLRLDLAGGAMIRAQVHVLRRSGRGMALRFVDLEDADRLRLAAFLVRRGGLAVIPALEQRFGGWARMAHPLLRRELRHQVRHA
jgi:hypothetical protein